MDRDERSMVIDLLHEGDNSKTLRKIIDNYPHLGDEDYVEKWESIVAKVISESGLELLKYPVHGNAKTKELKNFGTKVESGWIAVHIDALQLREFSRPSDVT